MRSLCNVGGTHSIMFGSGEAQAVLYFSTSDTIRTVRRHAVFGLCVRASARPCVFHRILKVIARYLCGDFTKRTTSVELAATMNRLDFEIKRSKVKVTARPDVNE